MTHYYEDYAYYPSAIVSRVVNTVIGIIEFALGVRFVLELLGANAAAGFVAWVYGLTNPLIAPFVGIFPSFSFSGFVIDISTMLAMIAYSILGWLIMYIFGIIIPANRYYYDTRPLDV